MPQRRRTTIDENKNTSKYCCAAVQTNALMLQFLFGNQKKERTIHYLQKEKFVIKLRDAKMSWCVCCVRKKREREKMQWYETSDSRKKLYKNINKRRQSGKMLYKNYESQWKRWAEVKYELWSLKCFSVNFFYSFLSFALSLISHLSV